MLTVSLLVSPFENENPDHEDHKQRAMDLFRNGRTQEAQSIFKQLRAPSTQYLRTVFPNVTDDDFHSIVGMFGGILEPSTKLDLHFHTAEDWSRSEMSVKQRLVAFGRKFKQSNVHLVELKAVRAPFADHGIPLVAQPDVTHQKQLYVRLSRIGRDAFENYMTLESVANQVGIENITLDVFGSQVLLYTIGQADYAKFDQQCSDLMIALQNRHLVDGAGIKDDIALVNYGSQIFGGTHSYKDADLYLNGRLNIVSA